VTSTAAAREAHSSDTAVWPADAVEVGRVVGAWGVKGWIKLQPLGRDAQALLAGRPWYLLSNATVPGHGETRSVLAVRQARRHSDMVVALADGFADRAQAETLRGARVFVSRAGFPAAGDGEYYWVDLIGAEVINREGRVLGSVTGLLDTGANDVLCVAPASATPGERTAERLIPFVAAYVDQVDIAGRRIVVDWSPEED
jgi:16S rRNA processing protein RimM